MPAKPAPETDPVLSTLDNALGRLSALESEWEDFKAGDGKVLVGDAAQAEGVGAKVLADIKTIFGHLGIGHPTSAT
jgi:hypothetical protein